MFKKIHGSTVIHWHYQFYYFFFSITLALWCTKFPSRFDVTETKPHPRAKTLFIRSTRSANSNVSLPSIRLIRYERNHAKLKHEIRHFVTNQSVFPKLYEYSSNKSFESIIKSIWNMIKKKFFVGFSITKTNWIEKVDSFAENFSVQGIFVLEVEKKSKSGQYKAEKIN